MIASASPETYEKTVSAVLASDCFDSAIVLHVPTAVTRTEEIARAIVRGSTGLPKPVVTSIVGVHGVKEGRRYLAASGFPAFDFPEEAVNALGHATDYGVWRATRTAREPRPDPRDLPAARRVLDQAKKRLLSASATTDSCWLDPEETTALLEACGIATPRGAFVPNIEAAVTAAERIGYPVVAKVVSPHVVHKTEVGGVRLGLRDPAAVRAACRAMVDRVNGVVDGFVVQEMLENGTELIAGVSRDPTFGPLVGFGAGGTHAELLADIAFRIAPITPRDARELVDGIRSQALLNGFRGQRPVDRNAVVGVLLALSALVDRNADVLEVDLNPLVETSRHGLVALDARVRVRCR